MEKYFIEVKDVIKSQISVKDAFLVGFIWLGLTFIGVVSLFLAILKGKSTRRHFSFIGINPNISIM